MVIFANKYFTFLISIITIAFIFQLHCYAFTRKIDLHLVPENEKKEASRCDSFGLDIILYGEAFMEDTEVSPSFSHQITIRVDGKDYSNKERIIIPARKNHPNNKIEIISSRPGRITLGAEIPTHSEITKATTIVEFTKPIPHKAPISLLSNQIRSYCDVIRLQVGLVDKCDDPIEETDQYYIVKLITEAKEIELDPSTFVLDKEKTKEFVYLSFKQYVL